MADVKQPQLENKNKPEVEDELAGSEAPLLEHLIELRKRLIYCAIAIVVLMVGCFLISKNIFDILLVPYRGVYADRPRRPGSDVDVCFSGHIAVTRLRLF